MLKQNLPPGCMQIYTTVPQCMLCDPRRPAPLARRMRPRVSAGARLCGTPAWHPLPQWPARASGPPTGSTRLRAASGQRAGVDKRHMRAAETLGATCVGRRSIEQAGTIVTICPPSSYRGDTHRAHRPARQYVPLSICRSILEGGCGGGKGVYGFFSFLAAGPAPSAPGAPVAGTGFFRRTFFFLNLGRNLRRGRTGRRAERGYRTGGACACACVCVDARHSGACTCT